MLQTMLIKIGLSIFKWLPLERIVAKVLTAAIECHRSLKMYHLRSIQNVPPMSPFVSCL